jgi:hypothetical protein
MHPKRSTKANFFSVDKSRDLRIEKVRLAKRKAPTRGHWGVQVIGRATSYANALTRSFLATMSGASVLLRDLYLAFTWYLHGAVTIKEV